MNEPQARRFAPAEWARAIFEHWRSLQPKGASRSEDAFAHAARLSRGGYRKIVDGENRPRFDTIEKLRKIAPPHLRSMEPDVAGARQDPSMVREEPANYGRAPDPDQRPLPEPREGAALTEGAIVARDIDRAPEAIRERLRNAALVAIQEEKRRIEAETKGGSDEDAKLMRAIRRAGAKGMKKVRKAMAEDEAASRNPRKRPG